jgi:uncharacterized RDD family membrane protein YckC
MVNATPCPACGHVNAVAAEACANCGEPLAPADIPVHPGETYNDPDDLSFPEPPPPPKREQKLGAVNVARGTSGFRAIPTDDVDAIRVDDERGPDALRMDDDNDADALREVAERISRRRALRDAIVGPPTAPTIRPRHYAGFVIRLLAFAIDLFVLLAFVVPLSVAVVYGVKAGLLASGTRIMFVDTEEAITELVSIAWFAMAALYFVLLHRKTGQTIGKAVVGIAVRSARDLAGIGVVRSAVRALGYALSASFLFVGFLTVLFSPRKRGWHDYLAGTCVVHLAPEEV